VETPISRCGLLPMPPARLRGTLMSVSSLPLAHLVGLYAAVALLMILAGTQKKKLRWKEGHRCRACGAIGPHHCPRRLVP